MTLGYERFTGAYRFDDQKNLFNKCHFVFLGHMLLQEGARSDGYEAFNERDRMFLP